jgi:hypothetical protein
MKTEINYVTDDKSMRIKLVYITGRALRIYHHGKSWPIHTQCLLFINDLFVTHGHVIKHENDVNNQKYAYILATKKAITGINIKFLRTEIWELVHAELKNGVLSK